MGDDPEAKADAELLRKNREFWAYLSVRVDPEQPQVGSEQLKVDEEELAERAATYAEEAKADAEALKHHRELWAYLVTFFLRFHDCSVQSIFSVLQSFGIDGTEEDFTRCIEENELLTHKYAWPQNDKAKWLPLLDGDEERSVFKFNQMPELHVECVNLHQMRVTMTHPLLPAVRSAALVFTKDPEYRRIAIEASRKQVVFTIMGFNSWEVAYPLVRLHLHYRRCMVRAVGIPMFWYPVDEVSWEVKSDMMLVKFP